MAHTKGMSKHQPIHLSDKERKELEQLIKSGKHAARVISRARTLLLLDRSQGQKRGNREVMAGAMVSQGTIANLKKRYFAEGLQALYDRPHPGATPKIDGEVEAHLIALVCSDPPEGQARWTLRLLADQLVSLELVDSISHVAVGTALKKTNLSLGK